MLLTSPPCRSLVIYRTKHNGSEDDIPPICSPPPPPPHHTRYSSEKQYEAGGSHSTTQSRNWDAYSHNHNISVISFINIQMIFY